MKKKEYFNWALTFVILGVGIYVALSPSIVYAPAPRVVLFFIISVIPAILFGSEISSKFNLSLPGFAFAVAGAGAVFFGALFSLNYLAKPEQQIAVFSFYDEEGNPFPIDAPGIVKLNLAQTGLTVTDVAKGNDLILIFPEQVAQVEIEVTKFVADKPFQGILTYAGNRTRKLTLGKELIQHLP